MLAALGYTWTAVYAAFFFPAAAARVYAALITVALGASLLTARAPTDVFVWITICTMVWVAVAILARLNERLRAQAHTDSLTGLLNRAGFALAANRQRAMSRRRGEPVSLALIDLDAFKLVNDRRGHRAGDRLLVELGQAWTAALRPGDLLARFGGDEFVLLMPGVDAEQSPKVLERLQNAHPTAWTAGTVVCTKDESLEEAIDRADQGLYMARRSRRAAAGGDQRARATRTLQPGRA
jgi:diguanylate cyclase (GGDEF)-like protein